MFLRWKDFISFSLIEEKGKRKEWKIWRHVLRVVDLSPCCQLILLGTFCGIFLRRGKLGPKSPFFLKYICERWHGEKCGGMMSSRWLIGLGFQLPNSIPPQFSVAKEMTQKCGVMRSVALNFSCKNNLIYFGQCGGNIFSANLCQKCQLAEMSVHLAQMWI